MAGFAREVARRVYSSELRDSDLTFRENEDQYAPLYLITPTGARCNRVLLVGTLTERDNLGDEVEYWRGRVADPTGSIFVYAGQYQPEAAQVLAATEPPAFVAVVGKPSVYETEDGKRLISVRAEAVQRVDAETRDRWVLETAARTLDRIEAFRAFLGTEGAGGFSSGDQLMKKPEPPGEAAEIGKAHLHYGTDLEKYRQMVIRALASLKGEMPGPKEGQEAEVRPGRRASDASGPTWDEEEEGFDARAAQGDPRRPKDLKVPLSFDGEEDLRDAERIEEEELFFGEREKAPSKKRRER